MMTFEQLAQSLRGQVDVLEQMGDPAVSLTAITDDSRAIQAGSLFVAVKGEQVDGHRFISSALTNGAAAVVMQEPVAGIDRPYLRVADSRKALGYLGSRFYGDPSGRLRMIGITGTNGKTTTSYVCKALLEAIGGRVGLIGTVAYQIGSEVIPASHTTPGALELQQLLKRMVDGGCSAAVMEVSSHALAQDRVSGCEYDVAVFSNLTQDHLDFHKTMEDYFQAKLRLFTGLTGTGKPNKRAIVNSDDPSGARIASLSAAPVWTYGIQGRADLRAEQVRLTLNGTTFTAADRKSTRLNSSHT